MPPPSRKPISMEKNFLATCVIFPTTEAVSNPPAFDSTFLVPSGSKDSESFETLTIRTNGKVERQNKCECKLTAFPLMYVSSAQCGASGDIELEPSISMESSRGVFYATRTRPFPGKEESSVVLLSGSIKNCSGSMTVGTLPVGFVPSENRMFVCSPAGDFVEVMKNGEIVLHAVGGSENISLDNVRFIAGTDSGNVRARLPFRSSVHSLAVGRKETFGPIQSDLLIPVSVRRGEKFPFLSVVCFAQSGNLIPLWDDPDRTVVSDILISSLLVSAASESLFNPLRQLTLTLEEQKKLELLVIDKLSALSFSELSGEDPIRCIRRDRTWRQTGVKTKTARETIH
jgi:hypothetical protein